MHTRIQGQRVVVSAVTAAAAALWIGGIAGCASDNGNTDADYVKVCKDPATGERVEDKKCDDDTGPASHSHSHPARCAALRCAALPPPASLSGLGRFGS